MAGKAKPRTKPARLVVTFEVLQNGATLISGQRRLKRRGALTLTSAPDGALALPYYPLPNQHLEFMRFDRGVPVLIAAHKWEGFCTSKGELIPIARTEKGRREIVMLAGDYASVSYGDLRIMVKVGPAKPAPRPSKGRLKGYGGGLISLLLPTVFERRSSLVATLVAGVILGGAAFGLLRRQVHRPERLRDIAGEHILPFVSPDHLRHGPEALQEHLDRKNYLRSVVGFYEAYIATLMGWPNPDAEYVLASTTEAYAELHAEARALKNAKVDRQQEVDRLQDMKADVSIAAIPAVVGESAGGSTLRLLDKTAIMHTAFAENIAAKREIILQFPKDPEYNFEDYKNAAPPKNEEATAYLSKIRPWGGTTDEEAMYAEADALTRKAERVRRRNPASRSELKTPLGLAPVGLGEGARYASFAYKVDFMIADEKLAKLQASEYGQSEPSVARPIVREPLVGVIEKDLIERFISQHKFQLQLCYELALKRNELASGTMEWRWRIDSRGTISDIALVSSNIRDNRMAQCIKDKISQWRFPRPRRGAVEISYPFEFEPSRG